MLISYYFLRNYYTLIRIEKVRGVNKFMASHKTRSLAFIDDAGDPGFKFDSGSSRYFVIACVIFANRESAEAVMTEMCELRRLFGWNKNHEFKFNKLRRADIKTSLAAIAEHTFTTHAAIVDKTLVQNHELKTKPASFYNFVIREVLARADTLENAKVRLDGNSSKAYKKQIVAYFKKAVNTQSRKIAGFDVVDSKKDDLVQLADLVVGSIYRSLQTDKTDRLDYLNIIRKRIDDIWYFE
jgi:hypothetical protein